MFSPAAYELLDFGQGRKLERFGEWSLDRPSPAATGDYTLGDDRWRGAHARFTRSPSGGGAERERGKWHWSEDCQSTWMIEHPPFRLQLQPTPAGQVGLFPEQAENWDWLAERMRASDEPLTILNLFGYTGGSTLACAARGARVVHVDAARPMHAWARGNAQLSDLSQAPIRWIVEDARRFVRRELDRGRQYHGVILDPPTYGHGPTGRPWKISEDLLPLLRDCAQLTAAHRALILLTCHTPGLGPDELTQALGEAFAIPRGQVDARELRLHTADGRSLDAGVVARWSG